MDVITCAGVLAFAFVVLSLLAFARGASAKRGLVDLQRTVTDLTERLESLERAAAVAKRARLVETTKAVTPTSDPVPAQSPIGAIGQGVEPTTAPAAEPAGAKVFAPPLQPSSSSADAPPEPGAEEALAGAVSPLPAEAPNAIVSWLLRGNPLAKLGVVLLFFGLAYLLKFATDRGMLPIELRLAGAAAIAIGLLGVGWRLRRPKPVYALTLQGGSIGALYLTSFAAFRVYALLPHGVVFGLLVVICAASVVLAVLQRAQSLAVMASLGGYLAPILLSTGEGNHVALFGYYALLSAGILAISVWQAWRPLNLVGFFFTFGVGLAWGAGRYHPSLFAGCEFFLILNLAIYGVLSVLTSFRHGDARTDAFVDGTLVFGTPLVGFGMQVGLTNHWTYGPAFSALGFSAVYLPLAWWTLRQWRERGRRVTASFLALGAGFGTLAIPLALSARWTSLAWALEGLGVLWAGRTQRQPRMAWSGTGLLFLAGGAAAYAWFDYRMDTPTFLLVAATTSLTWLGGSWLWRTGSDESFIGRLSAGVLFAGGIFAWLVLIVDGSMRLVAGDGPRSMLILMAISASALSWSTLGKRWCWDAVERSAYLLWPFAALALLFQWNSVGHPLGSGAWSAAWFVGFVTAWRLLLRTRHTPDARWLQVLHISFCWLVFACASIEVNWHLRSMGWGAEEWNYAGLLVLCAAAIGLVTRLVRIGHWAVVAHPRAYRIWGLLPALVLGSVLLVGANLLDGRMPGYPYVPLVNPVEEAAAFALLMAAVWWRQLAALASDDLRAGLRVAAIALAVWWGNGIVLRTVATLARVPWLQDALWRSAAVQTTMALVWTVAALACMAVAARRASRRTWFAGAAGLAVVVVKLFLVDSARGGGLARAVAFIGVALLVLVIGYVAPLPPRSEHEGGVSS